MEDHKWPCCAAGGAQVRVVMVQSGGCVWHRWSADVLLSPLNALHTLQCVWNWRVWCRQPQLACMRTAWSSDVALHCDALSRTEWEALTILYLCEIFFSAAVMFRLAFCCSSCSSFSSCAVRISSGKFGRDNNLSTPLILDAMLGRKFAELLLTPALPCLLPGLPAAGLPA